MGGAVPLRPLYVFTAWAGTTAAVPITRQLHYVACATGTCFKQRIANYGALFRNS